MSTTTMTKPKTKQATVSVKSSMLFTCNKDLLDDLTDMAAHYDKHRPSRTNQMILILEEAVIKWKKEVGRK